MLTGVADFLFKFWRDADIDDLRVEKLVVWLSEGDTLRIDEKLCTGFLHDLHFMRYTKKIDG